MILTLNDTFIIGGLTNSTIRIKEGVEGLERPDTKKSIYPLEKLYKSVSGGISYTQRVIRIKCTMVEATINDFYDLRKQLQVYTFDGNNEIPFTITTIESPSKVYAGRGYIDVNMPLPRLNFVDFDIVITCLDPFFYSTTLKQSTVTFSQPGIKIPFQIPAKIGGNTSSRIFVTNSGDVELNAKVVITAPGRNFTIFNATTNKTTTLGTVGNEYNLNGTATVTIENPTVLENGVTNRYSYLNNFDALILAKGVNELYFTVDANNNVNTTATISFTEKFDCI